MPLNRLHRHACLVAMVLLAACSSDRDLRTTDAAVAAFHQALDAGQLTPLYEAAAPELKQASTQADFTQFLSAVHRKLGDTRSTAREFWRINWQGGGEFVSLRYGTEFEHGSAKEEFVFRLASGTALLVSYNINSKALVVN